jgi:hypothetical protein
LIAFAQVAVGDGVVVGCVRCSPPTPPEFRAAEAVVDEAREVARSWERGPGPNIALVGPEPFAHPELPAIVGGIAALGIERIRLRTDGGALSVEGNAGGALHAGVRQIEIVLLGDREAHDSLSATSGLFDAAQAGAVAFAAASSASGVTTALTGWVPVCRHNLEALPAAVASLARMGAVAVELDLSDSALVAVGAKKWVSAALETGMVNGVWVHLRDADAILARGSALHAVAPSRWRRA